MEIFTVQIGSGRTGLHLGMASVRAIRAASLKDCSFESTE